MLGGILALISAMMFALNTTALRRGVLTAPVHQAIAITVPLGLPLFFIILLMFDCFDLLRDLSMKSIFFFSIAGIIHLVIGRYCNYRSTQLLGATQSGPITQLALLISLFFALALLNEEFNLYLFVGIGLVFGGPTIIFFARKNNSKTKSGVVMDHKRGYLWGLFCALAFGSSPFFIKLGLDGGGLRENIVGGFIAYLSASLLVLISIIVSRSKFRDIYVLNNKGVKWFILTGFLGFLSHLFRYMALGVAPITIVEPIQRSTIIFRVIFGWLLNRQHEMIDKMVLFGILLSVAGVYLIIYQI